MDMHGVKRVKQSQEAIDARKRKEKAKIEEYLKLTTEILSRKRKQDWSKEAFDLTSRMLAQNPEFYTVWNYRRHILLNGLFQTSLPTEINDLISNELDMTAAAMRSFPKVYWIWNHRRWCLDNIPTGPDDNNATGWRDSYWNREFSLVEKMLGADPRNFHAWNYRRYVLANTPVRRTDLSELIYTTKKIEANFSNFSAWHQRSKVLRVMWDTGKLNETASRENEFDLVRNAMYTDPEDQSVWLYHRWLIGSGEDLEVLQREIEVIKELLAEQPDSKWCMESIVHYQRLLLSKGYSQELADECLKLLKTLQELDAPRRRRYQDIEIKIKTAAQA